VTIELSSNGSWARSKPEQVFRTLPGIGPDLTKRIHDTLQVDTLEALEVAAHDGRLTEVPGIGLRRAEAIRSMLAARLANRRYRLQNPDEVPDVAALLDVDAEYRRRAADHDLPRIAPKRFNRAGEPWLSVRHTRRGDWSFTALFSNTAKAHALGKTADWVVIYFHHDHEAEAQCSVVSGSHGALADRRIVRGREGECAEHYARADR
jgi:hypothetical protein